MKKKKLSRKAASRRRNRPQLASLNNANAADQRHRSAGARLKPKKPANGWAFIDGEEMHQLHPRTFHIYSESTRRNVKVGQVVKLGLVGPGAERFWVRVVSKQMTCKKCVFSGEVDSGLLESDGFLTSLALGKSRRKGQQRGHGIYFGDLIEFGPEHILAIYK